MKYLARVIILMTVTMSLAACGQNGETAESTTTAKEQPKDGPYAELYDNGATYIKGTYRKGLREGVWESYYPTGRIMSSEHYVNDVVSGTSKSYYPSGRMRYRGNYLNGQKVGRWYFFSDDGKEEKVVDMDEKRRQEMGKKSQVEAVLEKDS